jgi:hypothetical protein
MTDGPTPFAISWGFHGRDDDDITIDRMRQRDGSDKFAVRYSGCCINRNGEAEHEPRPSSRSDEFLARCRFDTFEEAVAIAHARIAKEKKDG